MALCHKAKAVDNGGLHADWMLCRRSYRGLKDAKQIGDAKQPVGHLAGA